MRVLDLSAGRRNIWINKRRDDVVWLDIREEVRPSVVADSGALPFAAGTFDLVVFDPPHTTFGPNAQMAARFGSYKAADIRALVHRTGREIARVLRQDGLCAFKWSNHGHQSVEAMLSRMPHLDPLFGQVVKRVIKGHESDTRWVLLRRRDDFAAADAIWQLGRAAA
jgi:SAM-dependent methyltransferase